jgi:hypothetical protein
MLVSLYNILKMTMPFRDGKEHQRDVDRPAEEGPEISGRADGKIDQSPDADPEAKSDAHPSARRYDYVFSETETIQQSRADAE